MSKKRDAALVRALAAIAAQKPGDVDRTLIVRAQQLIKRLEGRDAGLRHHRPAKRRASLAVAATVALAAFCGTVPAYARGGASHDRTCQAYRVEHPDFRGPFDVIAHKAAWNGSGFDDAPDQFTCPAAPGGEGVQAMRLVKVPTSHKQRKDAE